MANTAIDFGVYAVFVLLGMSHVLANYPATTTALIFSFFANKQYTFRDNQKSNARQIGLFLLITLAGAWVLQPVVISLVGVIITATDLGITNIYAAIFEKLCAAAASMVWNYFLYKRLVFRNNRKQTQ